MMLNKLTLLTVWNARFKFPDANAADRPEINTLVILVEALEVTAMEPMAEEDERSTSVADPCTVINPSDEDPAGRVDVVKALRLSAANVRYGADDDLL